MTVTAAEELFTAADVRWAVRKARRLGYRKGQLDTIRLVKAFDESKVNRDHGKFSSQPGSEGSDKPPTAEFYHQRAADHVARHAGALRRLVNDYRRGEVGEDYEDAVAEWEQDATGSVRRRYQHAHRQAVRQLAADFGPDAANHPGLAHVRAAFEAAADHAARRTSELADYARDHARTDDERDLSASRRAFDRVVADLPHELYEAHGPIYDALKPVRDELAGERKGEFQLGRYFKAATVRKALPWREQDHPRDKDGTFIAKDEIKQAQTDPAKAKTLRDRVRDEDKHLLDYWIAATPEPGNNRTWLSRRDTTSGKEQAKDLLTHAHYHAKLARQGQYDHQEFSEELYKLGGNRVTTLRSMLAALGYEREEIPADKSGMARLLRQHATKIVDAARTEHAQAKLQGTLAEREDRLKDRTAEAGVGPPPEPVDGPGQSPEEVRQYVQDLLGGDDSPPGPPETADRVEAAADLHRAGVRGDQLRRHLETMTAAELADLHQRLGITPQSGRRSAQIAGLSA